MLLYVPNSVANITKVKCTFNITINSKFKCMILLSDFILQLHPRLHWVRLNSNIMTTTITEGQKYDLVISVQTSRSISKFPIEVVRLVFEVSVALGPQAGGDQ